MDLNIFCSFTPNAIDMLNDSKDYLDPHFWFNIILNIKLSGFDNADPPFTLGHNRSDITNAYNWVSSVWLNFRKVNEFRHLEGQITSPLFQTTQLSLGSLSIW